MVIVVVMMKSLMYLYSAGSLYFVQVSPIFKLFIYSFVKYHNIQTVSRYLYKLQVYNHLSLLGGPRDVGCV